MKRNITKSLYLSTVLILSLAVLNSACNSNESSKKGSVSFTPKSNSSALTAMAEGDISFLVSIEDDNGLIYERERLSLFETVDDDITSRPLRLQPGSYRITEFLVVSGDDDKAIFVTPRGDAPLGYLVNTPLPHSFEVAPEAAIKMNLEVLSTEDRTPEEFGYSTFGIQLVETLDFVVIVFTYDEQAKMLTPTKAQLVVKGPNDEPLFDGSLEAGQASVKVRTGYGEYHLEATKAGYAGRVMQLSEEELALHFEQPLEIVLTGTGLRIEQYAEIGNGPAAGLITFDSGDKTLIAMAQNVDAGESGIHALGDHAVEEMAKVSTAAARDWEHFAIEGQHFLAVANYGDLTDFNNPEAQSVIYSWNESELSEIANFPTMGAMDWEHVTIGEGHYMVLANSQGNEAQLHAWDGTTFSMIQSIPANEPMAVQPFLIQGQTMLAVGSTWDSESHIYVHDGQAFTELQTVATTAPMDFQHFELEGKDYLAIANLGDTVSLYSYAEGRFAQDGQISIVGPTACEFFSINERQYLAVTSLDDWMIVYRWFGSRFAEVGRVPARGPLDLEYFESNGQHYLAVANDGLGAVSVIYELSL